MMLVEHVAALHEVDLFSAVPGRVLAAVAATAEEVTVEPGSTFIEHGAVEDCLYVVVSGRPCASGQSGLGRWRSSVGELAVLVPEAAVCFGHGSRPDAAPEVAQGRPGRVACRPARARTRVIRALVVRLRARADDGADRSAALE